MIWRAGPAAAAPRQLLALPASALWAPRLAPHAPLRPASRAPCLAPSARRFAPRALRPAPCAPQPMPRASWPSPRAPCRSARLSTQHCCTPPRSPCATLPHPVFAAAHPALRRQSLCLASARPGPACRALRRPTHPRPARPGFAPPFITQICLFEAGLRLWSHASHGIVDLRLYC